jgi:adenylylsulfate kinase
VIILLCGIPGSGKTTIAKILAQWLEQRGRVRLISSDDLRTPVYRKLFNQVAADRSERDFLILDATFYKKEWRCQVNQLAEGEPVLTIYLSCPLATALARNKSRRPNISEKALHIMFHRMRAPQHPTLLVNTDRISPTDAAGKIAEYINNQRSF